MLDERADFVLNGDAFDDTTPLERRVDVGGKVQSQALLRPGLRLWLRRRGIRWLPSPHPLICVGRQVFLNRAWPHAEIHLLFLARHDASFSTSLASDVISLLAMLSASSSSTVRPWALSAKTTRWHTAVWNTGCGYCLRALATSRPIAVLAILRLMTKAALRSFLYAAHSCKSLTVSSAAHTSN